MKVRLNGGIPCQTQEDVGPISDLDFLYSCLKLVS